MKHTKEYLEELHNRTYKPRPQWWIDKVTKAYKKSITK